MLEVRFERLTSTVWNSTKTTEPGGATMSHLQSVPAESSRMPDVPSRSPPQVFGYSFVQPYAAFSLYL